MKDHREKAVYNTQELSGIFQVSIGEIQRLAQNRELPFPALRIKNKWYFPKAPIDDFLAGVKNPNPDSLKKTRGRPRRWHPAKYVHYNFPVPNELHEKFTNLYNRICENLDYPVAKGDVLRLALEEFIERRPELFAEEEEQKGEV